MTRLDIRIRQFFRGAPHDPTPTIPVNRNDTGITGAQSANHETESETDATCTESTDHETSSFHTATSTLTHPASISNGKSYLENLPAEIQLNILKVADFLSFRNLIQSSPVYRRHYNGYKRWNLVEYIERHIGYVVLDGEMARYTCYPNMNDLINLSSIDYYLRICVIGRSKTFASNFDDVAVIINTNNMFYLLTYHCQIIEPLVSEMFKWMSNNFSGAFGTVEDFKRPTYSERVRITRALYRYQACCNIFGESRRLKAYNYYIAFEDRWILTSFFQNSFEPWEIEEINTVAKFVRSQYKQAVASTIADLRGHIANKTKLFRDHEALILDLESKHNRRGRIIWACSHGLRPLLKILTDAISLERLMGHFATVMTKSNDLWLPRGIMGISNQTTRPRTFVNTQNDKDIKMRNRDAMVFQGDREIGARSAGPPWAWSFVWRDIYSNIYGEYIPSHFRKVGYVFWDAERFEQLAVQEKLKAEWLARCGSQSALEVRNNH